MQMRCKMKASHVFQPVQLMMLLFEMADMSWHHVFKLSKIHDINSCFHAAKIKKPVTIYTGRLLIRTANVNNVYKE